jgi:hypothetical protein
VTQPFPRVDDRDLCARCLQTLDQIGVELADRGHTTLTDLGDVLAAVRPGRAGMLTWVTAHNGSRLGMFAVATINGSRLCPWHAVSYRYP